MEQCDISDLIKATKKFRCRWSLSKSSYTEMIYDDVPEKVMCGDGLERPTIPISQPQFNMIFGKQPVTMNPVIDRIGLLSIELPSVVVYVDAMPLESVLRFLEWGPAWDDDTFTDWLREFEARPYPERTDTAQ